MVERYGVRISTAQTGVQAREKQFGPGETKRVWEIEYNGVRIGINLGDITFAPTEAVVVPSEPLLRLSAGAVENALADAMGGKFLAAQSVAFMKILDDLRYKKISDKEAAGKVIKMLSGSGLPEIDPDNLAARLTTSLDTRKYYGKQKQTYLAYGAAAPIPSGKLKERGIKLAVLANVRPLVKAGGLTLTDMSHITHNAAFLASVCGATSITVPAVGTGVAFEDGFGLSMEDSMRGFFAGASIFATERQSGWPLKRIDFNMFNFANENNARNVAELVDKYRIRNILI